MTRTLAVLILLFCGWSAWAFPIGNVWLSGGLLIYLLALWRWPAAWMLAVPIALPALDLSFWAGRHFFGAFDLLVLATLGAGLWRSRPWLGHLAKGTALLALALFVVQLLITVHGLFPLYAPAPGAWLDSLSSTNALHQFKGVLWALLLWPMLLTARLEGIDVQRWLTAGMLAGLSSAVATIVWERGLFTGLFNLASPYRISGWFSAMLTGGAPIDAFLAFTTPFVIALFLLWRSRWLWPLGITLGLGALYALYVTYSRADYPALAAIIIVLTVGLQLRRQPDRQVRTRSPLRTGLAVGGMVLLAGLIALTGRNIQSRFETTLHDLDDRLGHWANTVSLLEDKPAGLWIGAGKGAFPRDYFWDKQLQGHHLALAQLYSDSTGNFVRFSKSDSAGNLFLQQRITEPTAGKHRLDLTLRTSAGQAESLLIEFCERHILKFRTECNWTKIKIPAGTTDWRKFSTSIDLSGLGVARFGPFGRPVDIAIMNRGIKGGLDIDSVQIVDPEEHGLLANPDFGNGWDHWFLSYGDHLRWHIKNLFVYWLYEGGILGLLVMLGAGLYVMLQLVRATRAGDGFATVVAAALAGGIMVGLFDSLFDEPRIALLFFLLVGAGLISRPSPATLAANAAALQHPMVSTRALRRAAVVIALALALAFILEPRLYTAIKVRLLAWSETNAPALSRLLTSEQPDAVTLDIASLPPWAPLSGGSMSAGELRIGDRSFTSLAAAAAALRTGDHLEIGPGVYRQPLVIRAHKILVSGVGHVVIERTSAEGKAAIITKGNDIRIENIECRHISVPDQNGACVRHEGSNLILDHVYFHDAEQGLLTGSNPGEVVIRNSRFSQLGKYGKSHGIYIGGGALTISDSQFLASKSWGHEIKSRAHKNTLLRTVVASLNGTDSRLIDVPHGGILQIMSSVLEQGPQSSNEGLIGFGLEGKTHPQQQIRLTNNIIIMEREGGNRLFQFGDGMPPPVLENNLVISGDDPGLGGDNLWLKSRSETNLGPYPALPAVPTD